MQAKQIYFPEKGKVAFETIELPEVGDNQVMIESVCSVISPGTELAWLHGLPNTPGEYPMRIAYCSCGRVVKKGAAVEGLSEGQLVAHGGLHASALVQDADKCTAVPEGVLAEEAACCSLVSIAMQGVRKAQVNLGDSAAVLGLGIIGNISGQLAKLCGATEVVGIDPIEFKREIAKECGYDWTAGSVKDALEKTCADGHFDVVLDVTGAAGAVPEALEAAKLFGRVVLSGSTRGITEKVNFYKLVHCKGVTIIGAHNFRRPQVDDMFHVKPSKTDRRVTMQLLASKRITVKPMISDKIAVDDAISAYERLSAKKENLITIAFDWT